MSLWRDPYGRDLAEATANYPLATSTAAVMPVAGAPSVVIRNGSRQNHITSPAIQQDRQLQWRFYSPQEKNWGCNAPKPGGLQWRSQEFVTGDV